MMGRLGNSGLGIVEVLSVQLLEESERGRNTANTITIFGVPTEILTVHLPNTRVEVTAVLSCIGCFRETRKDSLRHI
jgi:hypothetical protein